jgi:hypothetical protein
MSNKIYPDGDPPTDLFKRTARMILGEMLMRDMPMSQELKRHVPPEYCSDNSHVAEDSEDSQPAEEEDEE